MTRLIVALCVALPLLGGCAGDAVRQGRSPASDTAAASEAGPFVSPPGTAQSTPPDLAPGGQANSEKARPTPPEIDSTRISGSAGSFLADSLVSELLPPVAPVFNQLPSTGDRGPVSKVPRTSPAHIVVPATATSAQVMVGPAPVVHGPRRVRGDGRYAVVRVFYGTDRAVTQKSGGPAFEATAASAVSFGNVDVSIPRNHVVGAIESPSVLRMEFQRDPERHVSILNVARTSYDQFRDELRTKALNAATPSVLLFIHGYNVSFEDAALRTAQMAYDLDFAGAPVFFSWPSQGSLAGYFADEQAIERAQPDIEQFVGQVLDASPGAYLYVIAHSMGNRGMTRALMSFAHNHPDQAYRLREIVLAAPDIDTDVFVRQIAPGLVNIGAPVTLYASSTDRALSISRLLHGAPRAGDSGDNLVLLNGIETIDVTNVDTDLTGHSYVGDRRTILSDLYYIIQADVRAAKRFGLKNQTRNGRAYWVFNR